MYDRETACRGKFRRKLYCILSPCVNVAHERGKAADESQLTSYLSGPNPEPPCQRPYPYPLSK